MLRAFSRAAGPAHLVIAGAGPLERELRERAAHLEIADRVRFPGFVADLRGWMQAADGFLLTSKWEGLPMGLIEAAACALPSIATNVAGSREIIADGETGWLVPVGSSVLVSDRMRQAMKMTVEQRAALGQRARKRIVDSFSIDAVLDRWEQFYRGLLKANPKRRRWANSRPNIFTISGGA